MRQPQVRHQCCGGLRIFPLGGKQPDYLICFFAGCLVIDAEIRSTSIMTFRRRMMQAVIDIYRFMANAKHLESETSSISASFVTRTA